MKQTQPPQSEDWLLPILENIGIKYSYDEAKQAIIEGLRERLRDRAVMLYFPNDDVTKIDAVPLNQINQLLNELRGRNE